MKKILLPLLILSEIVLQGQVGTSIYPFLNTPFSARQAALGGDAISIRDYDVSFAGVNPALLNEEMDKQISLDVASFLANSKYGTLSYARDLEHGHLVAFNARYMDYGTIPRTDEAGFENGNFRAIDASVGLGYALQFEDEWTIGANANWITSKIDNYTSMAISGNVGVSYHFEKNKETLALAFRNFGYEFKTFNGTRERLPFRVDLGYTKILSKFPAAITITAHDLQQLNISSSYDNNGQKVKTSRKILDHFSFGAEIFPESAFNLRLGYNIKRGNELAILDQRSFAGLSVGFGIRFSNVHINYAHVRYNNSSNANQIGIAIDLSGRMY